MADDTPQGDEDFSDLLDAQDALAQDVPCLRCGYNLRGLNVDGQCPECGARIRRTLAFASQKKLCPTCMQSNHASLVVCIHCGATMNAAASTAAYFQTAPLPVASPRRRAIQAELVPPPPPVLPMILTWLAVSPFLCLFWGTLQEAWDRREALKAFIFSAVGLFLIALAVQPTRKYFRRLAEYRAAEARAEAAREKELEEEESGVGARAPDEEPLLPR